MGLLSGSVSLTRFNLAPVTDAPDFEKARFVAIPPGSEVRERVGFVPIEPDAPYEVGHRRYVFRVRIDKLRADPTAVEERVKELIRTELEMTGAPFVGPKKRKQLRQLAEEELIVRSTPRSKIIEGCMDGDLLYVASTAKNYLGTVILLLRSVGVIAEPKTPWADLQEEDFESEIVEVREPGHSALGCRFLRELIGDRQILIEPEAGSVRLQTHEAKIAVSGAVLGDLHRYLERGAEILSAKLLTGETTFRLDGPSFRIAGLRVETGRHEHWTELLDERLEKIAAVCELLDKRYAELRDKLRT